MDQVHLYRRGRLVTAAGPGGAPLPPAARARLVDRLTYYERKYDFEAYGETGNRFSLVERRLYVEDAAAGRLAFPLGLRPRVAADLAAAGVAAQYRAGPLAAENPAAFDLDWDGLFADFEIYPGQDTCLANVVAADGGIIASPTGSGKSVLIRMLCRLFHKARIHVVTKSATLADEIYSDLVKVIPTVGFVGAGRRRLGRVTVFIADSLQHGMGEADIVLSDECHELSAPKYAELLGRYLTARMFGFSATPTGRMDGRDLQTEALFGPVLYTMTYQDAEAAGRVVPITVEWIKPATGPNVRGINSPAVRERVGIWQNAARNAAIAHRVQLFDPDEQVMVMVKTIDHGVRLKQLLPDFTLCYAANGMDPDRLKDYVQAGLLPADEPLMTRDRLKALREAFAAGTLKKVIANYVWSTGVNFRHLGVLVRADAAASEIRDGQIPGRVCRRVPGVKESALMVDVWDDWDPGYGNKSRSRSRNYKKRGWAQVFSTAAPTSRFAAPKLP